MAAKGKQSKKTGFLKRTRVYLLEYVLYQVFLVILLGYIAYTVYALFWVLSGNQLYPALVEASVWFLSGSLVFIPLTYITYTRTRWEEIRNKARFTEGLRVAITYVVLIVGLIVGITFALIASINLIRFIVGLTDFSSVITLVAPSALMTVITAAVVFDVLSKRPRRSIKLFRPFFFGVCVLATGVLLVLTAIFGRTGAYDLQTMKDLQRISVAINSEHSYGEEVETDIAQLQVPSDVLTRAKERSYSITPTTNDNAKSSYSTASSYYKLCAVFKNATDADIQYDQQYGRSSLSLNAPHSAGTYCFKMYAY